MWECKKCTALVVDEEVDCPLCAEEKEKRWMAEEGEVKRLPRLLDIPDESFGHA